MKEFPGEYDHWCFACGKQNPRGLHLEFTIEGEEYVTTFTPGPVHQGYPGIMHGGIICTLLDEVMGRYLWKQGLTAPTAELRVRFRRPVPINEPLQVRGRVVNRRGRVIEMEASLILLRDQQVAATATGKFIQIKEGGLTDGQN
ncbi:MAG: PaaI family thioesterase [Bacillota bacterium]